MLILDTVTDFQRYSGIGWHFPLSVFRWSLYSVPIGYYVLVYIGPHSVLGSLVLLVGSPACVVSG